MIPTGEAGLRHYLIRNVDDRGHWSPIESHASQPGVPDYAYTIQGKNGWLELKRGYKAKPPDLRIMQRVWLERNVKNLGHPLILCCIDHDLEHRTFGLIHGNKYDVIYKKPIDMWLSAMAVQWENVIDWNQFLTILFRPHTIATRNMPCSI